MIFFYGIGARVRYYERGLFVAFYLKYDDYGLRNVYHEDDEVDPGNVCVHWLYVRYPDGFVLDLEC